MQKKMIGNMIQRIRKEKGITKTKLSELTDINIGHLTHIEKGERNPSHKTLKSICSSLDIPYQELLYTYDKKLSDEQLEYGYTNYISYNKIPYIENLNGFIECPADFSNASLAIKVPSNEMEPLIKKDSTVFVEQNTVLGNKDIGLFYYNDQFYIRRLMYRKGKFVLKADNKEVSDISVGQNDKFYIVGRIYL
jgi:phage repressor protein C with HTH and peptisase S24 domain